jgi:hypothetical protein
MIARHQQPSYHSESSAICLEESGKDMPDMPQIVVEPSESPSKLQKDPPPLRHEDWNAALANMRAELVPSCLDHTRGSQLAEKV